MEFLYRRFSKVALELKDKIKSFFQSQKIFIDGVTSHIDFTNKINIGLLNLTREYFSKK